MGCSRELTESPDYEYLPPKRGYDSADSFEWRCCGVKGSLSPSRGPGWRYYPDELRHLHDRMLESKLRKELSAEGKALRELRTPKRCDPRDIDTPNFFRLLDPTTDEFEWSCCGARATYSPGRGRLSAYSYTELEAAHDKRIMPSGLLSTPKPLSMAEAVKLKEEWDRGHGGWGDRLIEMLEAKRLGLSYAAVSDDDPPEPGGVCDDNCMLNPIDIQQVKCDCPVPGCNLQKILVWWGCGLSYKPENGVGNALVDQVMVDLGAANPVGDSWLRYRHRRAVKHAASTEA